MNRAMNEKMNCLQLRTKYGDDTKSTPKEYTTNPRIIYLLALHRRSIEDTANLLFTASPGLPATAYQGFHALRLRFGLLAVASLQYSRSCGSFPSRYFLCRGNIPKCTAGPSSLCTAASTSLIHGLPKL